MCWSFLVEVWLWISVLANAAGWILSALSQLNRTGYIVFFGITAALVWWGRKAVWHHAPGPGFKWQRLRRRFRRPLPFGFAVLALLVFLGGALYPPSAHTAMTYHIPRVLHWLAEGRWHWIHTPVSRMNHSFCGMEWMNAPLLLFLKTDRVMFLLNFIPFLLLPGLIFSVCVGLGVCPRVAWRWMWLLPTGYNFLLQGGGAGNDTFSAVYALAAIHFGCRAWSSRQTRDLWNSILASALLTGAKASNLPLLLPWASLIVALLPLLRRRLVSSLLVVVLAGTVSFLPCAVLNIFHCGDWLGTTIEVPHLEMHRPLVGILGNVFQLLTNNFVPPFFVLAGWWNQHAPLILPQAWVVTLESNFDVGFFWLGELPTEDWAGVGFGVSVLVAASVLAGLRCGGARVKGWISKPDLSLRLRRCVMMAVWVALLAYCIKSGLVTAARLISPYYPLLLPLLIVGAGQGEIIRRRWWKVLAGGVVVLAIAVLVCVPGRPLWPAQTILSKAVAAHPQQRLLVRAQKVYSVYAGRSDPLAGVRALLPGDIKVVGFMGTADDIDISFWRPYGVRRVKHILLTDSPTQIRQRGIQYVVLGGFNLKEQGVTLDAWLQTSGAELVATTNATLKVAEGLQPWYVARFRQ